MTWLKAVLEVSLVVAVTWILVTPVPAVVGQVAEPVLGDASTCGRAVEGVGGAGGLWISNWAGQELDIVDCYTCIIFLCRLSDKLYLKKECYMISKNEKEILCVLTIRV